jgi:hypothetical protein
MDDSDLDVPAVARLIAELLDLSLVDLPSKPSVG